MVKQVIWSIRAQNDRKQILEYWKIRNKSNQFSKKLNQLFKESVRLVAEYPQIGKGTDDPNVRVKIVKDFLVIYEETDTQILILTIWDSRRDPDKLTKILKGT